MQTTFRSAGADANCSAKPNGGHSAAPNYSHVACPFCGSHELQTSYDLLTADVGYVECECGARGPRVETEFEATTNAAWREAAYAAWNDRETA